MSQDKRTQALTLPQFERSAMACQCQAIADFKATKKWLEYVYRATVHASLGRVSSASPRTPLIATDVASRGLDVQESLTVSCLHHDTASSSSYSQPL